MRTRAAYNTYMREYMLRRYRERMAEATAFLGGKCARCDATDGLQFDHVDRSSKLFTVGRLWSVSKARFWAEVKKCQLLCMRHHEEKTLKDLGQISAKIRHGTLSTYRYCRCVECCAAMSAYNAHRNMRFGRTS